MLRCVGLCAALTLLPLVARADMAPAPVTVPSTPMPAVGEALSDMLAKELPAEVAAPRLIREVVDVHVYPELVHVVARWEIEAEVPLPTGFLMRLPDDHPEIPGPAIEALVVEVDGEQVGTSWQGAWFHIRGEGPQGPEDRFWRKGWRRASWHSWPLRLQESGRVVVTAQVLRLLDYEWWDADQPATALLGYDIKTGTMWAGEVEQRTITFHGHGPRLTSFGGSPQAAPTEERESPRQLRWEDPPDGIGAEVQIEAPLSPPANGEDEPPAVSLLRRSTHVLALQPATGELAGLIDELQEGLDAADPLTRAVSRRVLEALDAELRRCAAWLDADARHHVHCSPRHSRSDDWHEEEPPPEEEESEVAEPGPSLADAQEEEAELLDVARSVVWGDEPRHAWGARPSCERPDGDDGVPVELEGACRQPSAVTAGSWQSLYLGDPDASFGASVVADALLALAENEEGRKWWRNLAVVLVVGGLVLRSLWRRLGFVMSPG